MRIISTILITFGAIALIVFGFFTFIGLVFNDSFGDSNPNYSFAIGNGILTVIAFGIIYTGLKIKDKKQLK
jgi:hypothetical protein